MPYLLQPLLKIRDMRENRASKELTAARRAQAEAEQEREKKQEELDTFNKTKEERRDKIYEAVMGCVVSMDTLDDVRDAVTRIDEEGVLRTEARDQAQRTVEQRTEETRTAKKQYVTASRNKMKIEEHKILWTVDDLREQERLSDAEMEEFTGKKATEENDDANN